MNPNDLMSAIQSLATGQGSNGKSFKDLLAERSQFVQGAGDSLKGQVQNDLANGVNGARISPASALQPVNDFYSTQENKTGALVAQQTDLLKSLLNASMTNKQLDQTQSNADREFKLNSFNAGYDPTDPNGASSVIGLHVKNIKNGLETMDSLNSLPQGIQNRVRQGLSDANYDPASSVNGLVGQLENTYNDTSKKYSGVPLAHGNNPVKSIASSISDLFTKAGFYTNYAKQGELYSTLKDSFKSELSKLSGSNSRISPTVINQLADGLPTPGDSPDVAAAKFASIKKQISDTFYQGGNPPTKSGNPGNTDDLVNQYWGAK